MIGRSEPKGKIVMKARFHKGGLSQLRQDEQFGHIGILCVKADIYVQMTSRVIECRIEQETHKSVQENIICQWRI